MANTTTPSSPPRLTADTVQDQAEGLIQASFVWLRTHWLQILIGTVVGVAIVAALHFARRLGERLCRREQGAGVGWGTVVGRAVARTNSFFMVMLAAKLVAGYAGAPGEVATTITFLFTVAAVFQAAIWARELILGAIEHRTASEHYSGEGLSSAMGLIRLLVTFALFAIALIVVLDNLGVNVTGLVAGLGVGGIAIGLAAQGIFADLFAALAIIFDRPFRRGDAISYGASSGSVEEIGLKSTRIRGVNGELRVIANKKLLDNEIQNNTRRERRRTKFAIGLTYQTAPEVCRDLPATLKAVVEDNGGLFVRSGFVGFGASSLDFELEFDSASAAYQDAYDLRHVVGVAILHRLNAAGIEMAYPTQMNFTAAPDGRAIMPFAESVAPAD